ncbi:MAG: hypothetical protein QXQ46_08830 [Thermoplasmatales archaeon]
MSSCTDNLAKGIEEKKVKLLNNNHNHSRKKVSMSEIRQNIGQEWEFVQSINPREAIVNMQK